ncbi:cytochrome P450 9e2-like [Toxorhynchites rutilus septentrionalis]|uniref:cytochrome P450 9e2-like n=1 Tax=Toxorhynchites rutilus septentrionalis TaxID=329112 RepID=UPI0024788B22|nr:cytochrome P450 9e2-like [Toxorhynchites rutilus septentrionalis]
MVIYLLCGLLLTLVYYQLTKNKNYFRNKPIPTLPSKLLFGSTGPLMLRQISFAGFIESIYNVFPCAKIIGMFDIVTPVFVVRDPELIKRVMVRDFDHFADQVPVFGSNEYDHPNLLVARSLSFLDCQRWKSMRATVSPAFTGSKMRQMYELIVECSENAVQHYLEETRARGPQVYEMKNIFTRYASDVIASCTFGIQTNSSKDPETELYVMGKDMMNFKKISAVLKLIGFRVCPWLMARLGIDIFAERYNSHFKSLIFATIKEREGKGFFRRDLIQLLLQAKNGQLKACPQEKEQNEGFATAQEATVGTAQKTLSDTEIVAQCLIFFLAGYETVSTSLLFLTYELAINPEVQNRLHVEVMDTHASLDGKPLSYDAMQRMKYMDMVVTEVLRKWPPLPASDRMCVKDYTLDDGNGLSFTIDKGTALWVPIRALHHDPKYFPNPDLFDPERFNDERKGSVDPATFIPFGIGPRNCIGSRFGLAMMKTIVYYLLLHFSIERTAKTQVPPVLTKGFVEVIPENGVHLEFRPRV